MVLAGAVGFMVDSLIEGRDDVEVGAVVAVGMGRVVVCPLLVG
jgi:hypothetical protein